MLCFKQNYFSGNLLKSVPNDALKSFPNLMMFSLSDNKIKSMSSEDFKYNTKIKVYKLYFQ